jgi:co-chaperonin GroES (HSP10)
MTTTIKPLGDFIWVSPLADDSNEPYVDNVISKQGLLMVVQKQKAASRGYVRAIGPGKRDANGDYVKMPPILLGDLVRWTQGSAQRIELSGEKMYIVSASALIGVERP